MIAPHKYLDLNLSILNLGGLIINALKSEEAMKYQELLDKVILYRGQSAKDVFTQTLTFLYLIGKIEYEKEIDTITFVNNEA